MAAAQGVEYAYVQTVTQKCKARLDALFKPIQVRLDYVNAPGFLQTPPSIAHMLYSGLNLRVVEFAWSSHGARKVVWSDNICIDSGNRKNGIDCLYGVDMFDHRYYHRIVVHPAAVLLKSGAITLCASQAYASPTSRRIIYSLYRSFSVG